jgi:hypothetical protein
MTLKRLSNDYIDRLKSWNQFRLNLENKDIEQVCHEVNNYWMHFKAEKYYLHPVDIPDWPTPWELLSDNVYCQYARALGIIYTLLLLGIEDVDLVEVMYDNNENIPIVLVGDAKYLLNLDEDTLINTYSSEYKIIKKYNIEPLKEKAGIND